MSATGVPTEVRHRWGAEVLGVLDDAGPAAARHVQRGQALARRGAVEGLELAAGRVRATVAEDRVSPYRV